MPAARFHTFFPIDDSVDSSQIETLFMFRRTKDHMMVGSSSCKVGPYFRAR